MSLNFAVNILLNISGTHELGDSFIFRHSIREKKMNRRREFDTLQYTALARGLSKLNTIVYLRSFVPVVGTYTFSPTNIKLDT